MYQPILGGVTPMTLLIIVGVILLLVLFFPRYHKVPPNQALIISGKLRRRYKVKDADGNIVVKKFGYRIVRGGATFVIPFFERIDHLNLGLMQVDIKTTQPVPSQEYISVMVDGVANIKIGSDDLSIATAAEQFLNWKPEDIASIAQQVLEGNMREIIGRMTIADLVQNRDKFAAETSRAATDDMSNMGLEIINLTVQNFSDQDGVVETMATKNIVEKERDATIAKADIAYTIEEQRERKNFEAERAAAELLRLQKQTELERQQVEIQREKLNVDIREKAEAERDKRIFEAEAEKAERQAKADAELYEAEKLAEAIRLKGEAEAIAIERKADAMQRYGQAAMLEMLINQLPDIARAIGEPLAQTEKIILFGEGATTGLTRDMTGSMMQVFEAMKAATGMDIPKMLQTVSKGGLVGRQIEEAAGRETAE